MPKKGESSVLLILAFACLTLEKNVQGLHFLDVSLIWLHCSRQLHMFRKRRIFTTSAMLAVYLCVINNKLVIVLHRGTRLADVQS